MAPQTASDAEYRDASVEEASADTYEAERRFEGEVVIESGLARPILVRRTWDVDDSGTIHESTHYYAANEPTHSGHICDSFSEWEPVNPDNLESELLENLTFDAEAEVDSVLEQVSERVQERKLGVGNQ